MKSLSEWNKDRKAAYDLLYPYNRPRPNGILCPECGNELFDVNPNTVLTSYPPKKAVKCNGCGFNGYRLA